MSTTDILRDLIAFPTVSVNPNRDLIDYCAGILEGIGAEVTIIEDETGTKANLYATIGPRDRPGVLLSGHTDVVPIDGQDWTGRLLEGFERHPVFHRTEKVRIDMLRRFHHIDGDADIPVTFGRAVAALNIGFEFYLETEMF